MLTIKRKENIVMKHKWHKEICAWANGAEIEYKFLAKGELSNGWSEWRTLDKEQVQWHISDDVHYRIKPQPKEPRYAYAWLVKDEERIDFYFDKPEGVLNDDYHQYIGKIKLEQDDE